MRTASLLPMLAAAAVLAVGAPVAARAAEVDPVYAQAVVAESYGVIYQSANALGAPDQAYADFRKALTYVTLDMGDSNENVGDLTMSYKILEIGASYQAQFYDADLALLDTAPYGIFQMYTTETTIPYGGTKPYRYVKITCMEDELWSLDAVSAERTETVETDDGTAGGADEAEDDATDTEEPADEMPASRGLLVKLVDDGDPNTTADAAVYVIGKDGKRHAFPSEAVYRSWFKNYDDVAFIDPENLANYQLGANVTVRPGTWLVKVTADPKVYAVEPGGVLRWVTTEALAQSLYGEDWSDRVVDVPDTLWKNYTVGDPVTTEVHASGTLGVAMSGEVLYLDDDTNFTLPGSTHAYMRFNPEFYVRASDEKLEHYKDGGELSMDPDIAFPY